MLKIWTEQQEHNERVQGIVCQSSQEWVVTFILGLISECDELLRAMQWKQHRKPYGTDLTRSDKRNIAEELADVTKYVLCLWQQFGFDLADFLSFVDAKGELVAQLLRQEFEEPPPGTPILITDLDGTIANFRQGFIQWALDHDWLLGAPTVDHGTLQMDVELGVSYPQYHAWKRQFESSGGYYHLPAFADGISMIRAAQQLGAYIIAVTARPPDLKRVWYDTWWWLKKMEIQPNQLLFHDSERVLVLSQYIKEELAHPVLVLEDDPSLVTRIAPICPVVCRSASYNEFVRGMDNVIWTDNFDSVDILGLLGLEEILLIELEE